MRLVYDQYVRLVPIFGLSLLCWKRSSRLGKLLILIDQLIITIIFVTVAAYVMFLTVLDGRKLQALHPVMLVVEV